MQIDSLQNIFMKQVNTQRFAEHTIRSFKNQETIFKENENGREMFIVQEGEVSIVKNVEGKELELARITRGGFVGEMSLLESLPRSATAKAVGDTKLVVLEPGGFLLKIRRDPTFAFEMMQQLSRRIRNTNDRLLNLIKSNETSHEAVRDVIMKSVQ